MGIYKIDGSPYYKYDFTIGGTRHRGSTQTDRRAEAEAVYAKRRSEAVLGNHYDLPGTLTLSEAFARYEMEHGQFLKSYDTVRNHIDHLLVKLGKNTPLERIGQAELETYIAGCRSTKYRRTYRARTRTDTTEGKQLRAASHATINRRIAAFRRMHNLARTSWSIKVQNIAFSALRLDEPEPEDRTLSSEQAQRLLDNAPSHLRDYILITLLSGLRRDNILQLTAKQIDMRRRIMTVRGKSKRPGGKNIVVSIPDQLFEYFERNCVHEREHVISYNGKPVRRIYTAWRNLLERCEIDYIRPHDLRHTFGTWLYENTGDLRLVQKALHHTSIVTTMRYAHSTKDSERARINEALPQLRHSKSVAA